jgi:hypothetical protein
MEKYSEDYRHAQDDDADEKSAHYVSFRKLSNFFALLLTAMNSPVVLSRLVEVFVRGV